MTAKLELARAAGEHPRVRAQLPSLRATLQQLLGSIPPEQRKWLDGSLGVRVTIEAYRPPEMLGGAPHYIPVLQLDLLEDVR